MSDTYPQDHRSLISYFGQHAGLFILVSDLLMTAFTIYVLISHAVNYLIFAIICVIFSVVTALLVTFINTDKNKNHKRTSDLTKNLLKFKLASDCASNHIIITDPDGIIQYANQVAQDITGFTFAQMQGNTPRLWGRQMPQDFYERLWHTIKTLKIPFKGQITNKRQNGKQYIAKATISPILDQDNQLIGFIGMEEDISNQILDQERVAKNTLQLERLNRLMVGRELKMIELKEQLASVTATTK